MVQLNLLLDNRRAKSDGTYSIIFRIIQFKTVYTISSGISISKIHWDDKKRQVSHDCPNASSGNPGETDHPKPEQTDHLKGWRRLPNFAGEDFQFCADFML